MVTTSDSNHNQTSGQHRSRAQFSSPFWHGLRFGSKIHIKDLLVLKKFENKAFCILDLCFGAKKKVYLVCTNFKSSRKQASVQVFHPHTGVKHILLMTVMHLGGAEILI